MKYATFKIEELENTLLARKYAQLSAEAVQAIQDHPLLYAPQFIRSTESWEQEMKDGRLACWICVAPNANSGHLSLEQGQWVGIETLHGPLSADEYDFFGDPSLNSAPDDFCTRWIAGRLYVKSEHRNLDALSTMHTAITAYLVNETESLLRSTLAAGTQKMAKARVQLTAYHGTASYGMHRAETLRAVREVTRTEDLDYDGLLHQVPAGLLQGDDYTKPIGTLSESFHDVLVKA